MNDKEEEAYVRGHKMAYTELLRKCISELGYSDDLTAQSSSYILEREAAIVQLRNLCQDFGDNDWPENLHLADVIEKHLGRYLYDKETKND